MPSGLVVRAFPVWCTPVTQDSSTSPCMPVSGLSVLQGLTCVLLLQLKPHLLVKSRLSPSSLYVMTAFEAHQSHGQVSLNRFTEAQLSQLPKPLIW